MGVDDILNSIDSDDDDDENGNNNIDNSTSDDDDDDDIVSDHNNSSNIHSTFELDYQSIHDDFDKLLVNDKYKSTGTVNTSHTTTGSEIENRASQISKHGYHHRKNSGIIESRQRRTSYLSDNNKQEDHDENHQRNLNST